ncbi:MAG TPA: hypothetical protein VH877_05520 [Polyangia bacterium]|jgi:hypothetical protein|nr:hypothetical protein [Polyangia bacterium]
MPDVMQALPKGTPIAGWEAMAQAFEEAVQHDDPYRRMAPPSPRPAVLVLLRLLEAQEVDAATRLGKALTAWLGQDQGGATLRSGPEAVAWPWLQQLLPLRARLPPAVVAAIAHALLEGDLTRARPFLDAEYRVARASTLEALDVLQAGAPEMEALVNPFSFEALSSVEAARQEREGKAEENPLWDVLRVLVGLGLLLRFFLG